MAKIRVAKPSDQKTTEKAYQLLLDLIDKHPKIEIALWAGAMLSAVVSGCKHSGVTHEEFRKEMCEIVEHYREWWEQD